MKEIYEEALFKLRMFEREHNMRCFGDVVPQPYSDTIEELIYNYEKAIEIFKKKLCVRNGTYSFSRDSYFLGIKHSFTNVQELSKEEYELLKEVLENDL